MLCGVFDFRPAGVASTCRAFSFRLPPCLPFVSARLLIQAGSVPPALSALSFGLKAEIYALSSLNPVMSKSLNRYT